ncbi:MFS transporter [Streptomyces sp. NPDC086787]|uniref:MFS transporter n=1 Tax=Streptomyces sp. NPDC086787 TaxID=3365759 RepID=UPI0038116A91
MNTLVSARDHAATSSTGRSPSGLPTAAGVAAVTVLTSLPVFLPGAANGLISAEFGWSSARMGAILAAYWLASLAGAFVSKRAALPSTIERTLAIALGATCLGLLCAAAVPAAGLWLSSAMGGYSYGYTQPHTNALLMRRCTARLRAFAFGLKQAAVPAATLLASMAMPTLAGPAGWRPVFAGTAVLCGVAAVVSTRSDTSAGRLATARRDRVPPLRGDAFLLALSGAGFFGAMVGNGLGGFLVLSLTSRGTSLSVAGVVATAGAALNIAVRLIAGWLIGRVPHAAWAALIGMFATGVVGVALLTRASLALMTAGALLAYGGGWGWAGLLHYVIGLPYPGREQRATAYSQMGVSLGAATGPMACGLLFTVNSVIAWWMLMVAGLAAMVCVAIARGRGGRT